MKFLHTDNLFPLKGRKRFLSLLLSLMVLATGAAFAQDEEEEDDEEYEHMRERSEQEYERLADPATGTVPYLRLLESYRYQQSLKADSVTYPSEFRHIRWTERGPNNIGGRTEALLVDKRDATGQTLWAGSSDGGLWKATSIRSANPQWNPVNDVLPTIHVRTIAQDPVTPDVMYVGTANPGVGIFKTTDGGITWNHVASTDDPDFSEVNSIVVTNSQIIIAATNGGIMYSDNGGDSWQKRQSGNMKAAVLSPNGTIFIGEETEPAVIHRSINGGLSFDPTVVSALGPGRNFKLAASASDPLVVYATCADWDYLAAVVRTGDGGDSWNTCNSIGLQSGQSWANISFAVDPANANTVWVGTLDLYRTTDGGNTWYKKSYLGPDYTNIHVDHHSMTFDPNDSNVIFFGNDGGIYVTENAKDSMPAFTEKNHGYDVTMFYSCAIHPQKGNNFLLGGTQDNGSQALNEPGLSSGKEVTGGDGGFSHIDQNEPSFMTSSYVYNVYQLSQDGGNTFRDFYNKKGGKFINPTDYDNINNRLYVGGAGHFRILSPREAFQQGDSIYVPEFQGWEVSAVTCSEKHAGRVWFGLDNGNVVRVDYADVPAYRTITVVRPDYTGNVSSIAVDPQNEDHYLVTYSNFGVNSLFETKDNGGSWTSVEGNLPDLPVNWAIFAPDNSDQVLIGTELGVWTTDNLNDANTIWLPSTEFPNVSVRMLQYRTSDKQMVAGTLGRGMWTTSYFTERNNGVSVEITSPADFLEVFDGTEVTFNAEASTTADASISKVEFYINNYYTGTDDTYPYSYTVTLREGIQSFTAKAYDTQGRSWTSGNVTVRVYQLRTPENPDNAVSGLNYSYYEGDDLNVVADLNSSTYRSAGISSGFDISNRQRDDEFGFIFTGYIDIPADGLYQFSTASDDGSAVYIGSNIVFNNDGNHGNELIGGSSVGLKAGKHAITVKYFEHGGGENLTVYYAGPGFERQEIPVTALYRVQDLLCKYGTPTSGSLPSINYIQYNYKYVQGQGGPDLSNVTNMVISWDLQNRGLYNFSMSTNNGIPGWYIDLKNYSTNTFAYSNPGVTFRNTGIPGLDGDYYVAKDNGNFVLVEKSGKYTVYFSNSATAPVCPNARLAADYASGTSSFTAMADDATGTAVVPNPAQTYAEIRSDISLKSASWKVTNELGTEVTVPYTISDNSLLLDVNNLQGGVYMIMIKGNEKSVVKKMVITR